MKKIAWIAIAAMSMTLSADEQLATTSVDTWGVISNGKLAFQDYQYATTTLFWAKISLCDVASKVVTTAAPGTSSFPYYISSCLAGNNLLYIPYLTSGGGSGGTGGGSIGSTSLLYHKNLETSVVRQLVDNTAWKEMVWAAGNMVVWVDYRNYSVGTIDSVNSEVYAFNFSTNVESRITLDHAYQSHPFTDGTRIVWIDYAPGYGKLMYKSTLNATVMEINNNSLGKNEPRIAGNFIVWSDYRNIAQNAKNADIYGYNITTSSVVPICTNTGFQARPFVSNSWIVWEDYRNAIGTDSTNADIYGYNLSTGTESALVVQSGYQAHPTLSGDTLVWVDESVNPHKIMLRKLGSSATESARISQPDKRSLHSVLMGRQVTISGIADGQKHTIAVVSPRGTIIAGSTNIRYGTTSATLQLSDNLAPGVYHVVVDGRLLQRITLPHSYLLH